MKPRFLIPTECKMVTFFCSQLFASYSVLIERIFRKCIFGTGRATTLFFGSMLYLLFCIDVMNIKLYRCLTVGPMGTTADLSKKKAIKELLLLLCSSFNWLRKIYEKVNCDLNLRAIWGQVLFSYYKILRLRAILALRGYSTMNLGIETLKLNFNLLQSLEDILVQICKNVIMRYLTFNLQNCKYPLGFEYNLVFTYAV